MSRTKLVRYLVTGGTTFVVEYTIFLVAVYYFSLSAGYGQIISYLIAIIVNFSLLHAWTFSQNGKPHKAQIIKYGILVLFNAPVSAFIIHEMTNYNLAPFIAKIIVVIIIAIWNYFIYDKLIFRTEDAKNQGK